MRFARDSCANDERIVRSRVSVYSSARFGRGGGGDRRRLSTARRPFTRRRLFSSRSRYLFLAHPAVAVERCCRRCNCRRQLSPPTPPHLLRIHFPRSSSFVDYRTIVYPFFFTLFFALKAKVRSCGQRFVMRLALFLPETIH